MKFKLASAVLAVAGLFGASQASAAIVGGIDFGPFGTHLDTTTLAETLITGDGQTLLGYGQVNTINGNSSYSGGTDKLYFNFSYTSQNFNALAGTVEFFGGTLQVYKGTLGNLLLTSSATNMANIAALTPWVQLKGHGNLGGAAAPNAEIRATGTIAGSGLAFTGVGNLDVDTASAFGDATVRAFLDANTLFDSLGNPVDIRFSTSGTNDNLNGNDNTTGCATGTAAAGTWCIAGSADLRGGLNQVPEPASLALVGLALLGAAGASSAARKRKAS